MKLLAGKELAGDSLLTIGGIPQLRFGVYGAGGCTKTSLLTQFANDPRTSPALWLNVCGNPEKAIMEGRIPFVMNMDTVSDLLEPLNYIQTGQNKGHSFWKKWSKYIPFDEPFKSIICDTFSDWQGLLIDDAVGVDSSQLANYSFNLIKAVDPRKHGKQIATQTLFAARQMLMTCPVHVLLSFQENEVVNFEGDETGHILAGSYRMQLGLWGQSRKRIPTWLNLMGHMYWRKITVYEDVLVQTGDGKEVKKQKPVGKNVPVITWVDDQAHVKNQVADALGTEMIDPSAAQILDVIEQSYVNRRS